MRTWTWRHDLEKRETRLLRSVPTCLDDDCAGELMAVIPHIVGIQGESIEDRAQFIVDACNAAEAWSERNTGLSVEPPFSREAVTNVTMHPAPLGGLAAGNKTGGKRTLFRRTKPS